MIKLYHKDFLKLKKNQYVYLVKIFKNNRVMLEYYKFIEAKSNKHSRYSKDFIFQNLRTLEMECFDIRHISKKKQREWSVLYELEDGILHRVKSAHFAKISKKEEPIFIARLLVDNLKDTKTIPKYEVYHG